MNLYELSASELLKKIKNKELTSTEVVKYFIERIKSLEPKVNAFMSVEKDTALRQAENIDKKISEAAIVGSLAGLPVAIKDNICIKGLKTTCSSKILENFISPYDASVVRKLHSSDAVFIGKTNMDEFAMGSSTENSAYKTTRNPWNTEHIPGGSSGGSAACVSARMVPLAIGSDTGGSIRQPAGCCGVVGMKPTYGRVSRYGLVAFASSLDQIGPLATNVKDCALLLEIISGYDNLDSTSVDIPVEKYSENLNKEIKGLRLGLPKEYFIEGIQKEVKESVESAAKVLENLGCIIEEVSLPHTEYAVSVYYIIAPSEASANLERYDGVKYGYRASGTDNAGDTELIRMYKKTRGEGFGPEVKRRIMLGTYALSAGYYDAYYGKAQKVRTLIKKDFDEVFKRVDAIITPTAPSTAFKIGEKIDDPLQMYLSDVFTIPCNLAGLPGLSVPCGFSSDGLPIGLQILGKPFDEQTILRIGYFYEQSSSWHKQIPAMAA